MKTIELLERMRARIVERAIEEGILEKGDYKKYSKKYVEDGMNSFINLLNMLIINKSNHYREELVFLTINRRMLKDREELECKFKCRILSPGEIIGEESIKH